MQKKKSVNLFKCVQLSSNLKICLHVSSPSRSKVHFKFLCFFDGIIFPSKPKWFRMHEVLHISEILGVGITAILL